MRLGDIHMPAKQSHSVKRQVKDKKSLTQVERTGNVAYVMDPKQLPIALPRVSGDAPNVIQPPEWLAEAPKGAYFSPILLVRSGFYKSQVSAQVALRKWTERGLLEHPGRGQYRKVEE